MTTMTAAKPTAPTRSLTFLEPLPGFDDELAYALSPIDPQGLLYALRSVGTPELRFVLASPDGFFPDYHPELADEIGLALGSHQVELLVMLSIATGLSDATANLRAPVVIASATDRAIQVVLDDETVPMRRPLLAR